MLVTIFTPTYNRKDKIGKVYESLKKQENKDFEWLIVDDGSVDNTSELIEEFIKENQITIKYVKQNNGGKHVAYNTALNYATGKYFFCVDSDDWLNENFINELRCVSLSKEYSGFIAYKKNSENELLSDTFPEMLDECSLLTLNEEYQCRGEFSIIIRLDIAKKYSFPVFKNEKFMCESIVYDRIGEEYKFKLLNKVATICEYQEDGLTCNYNNLIKNNPSGFCLYFMQRVDLIHSFIGKINMAGKYHCFRIFSKNRELRYCGKSKILVFCTKPIGWLFWVYYKVKRGF